MPIGKLKELLDKNNVQYESIKHPPGYTAQEIAALAHVSGKEMAKTVMVKADGELAMIVLPAKYRVDLELVREVCGAEHVELATEEDFKGRFPECETGAMPPFGNLYNIPEYVDESLMEDEKIAFCAGTHSELIRIPFRVFEHLTGATIARVHS
jgi:Ala-tRNA(Pro) deacylase